MTKKIAYYPSIEETMDNFNFSDVRKYMKKVGWKWFHYDGRHEVPSIDTMRDTAYSLLFESMMNYDGQEYWVETGGFRGGVTENGMFYLTFNHKY